MKFGGDKCLPILSEEEIQKRLRDVRMQQRKEAFQRLLAFEIIPFIVIAFFTSCFVFGLGTGILFLLK